MGLVLVSFGALVPGHSPCHTAGGQDQARPERASHRIRPCLDPWHTREDYGRSTEVLRTDIVCSIDFAADCGAVLMCIMRTARLNQVIA
jgi:hypothetical protein